MKILIVNKFLFENGGSEAYAFQLGEQWKKLGHQVQYFGMEHPNQIVGNDWGCYTSNMDFHNNKFSKVTYPFRIIYSREAYKKIYYVLDQFAPDFVHINNFNFQLTPSIIYAITKYSKYKKKRIPIIMTAHDSQLVCPNHLMMIPSNGKNCFACMGGRFGNCVKNNCIHNSKIKSVLAAMEGYFYKNLQTYRHIDLLVCPSNFLRQKLSTNPILADRAITIPNFIGELISKKETVKVEKKDYILYFGRYAREKGIVTLLEICRQLPEISFIFAGSGPMKEEVSQIPNVIDKGFLTGEALFRIIAEARLVLFPSECNENCPLSVLEAQICGTPVIGSALGGTPEFIQEGRTGKLLEAGNSNLWIKVIRGLWENKKLLQEYSDNCRKLSFYTVEEYCDILLRKMKELR